MKRIVAFSSALALLLTACQSSGGDTGTTDPIKIGFIGPLTGEAAVYGEILHGAEMKIEELNAAGGVNGRPIELVIEDGRCTGSDAASAAQKLVNIDQVVAILGGGCSSETLAAAPIAEAAQIPLLSYASTSPDVTDAGDFVFRNVPSDALKSQAMANYFKENDYTKVAMISENTDFCAAFRDSLSANLEDMEGIDIVFSETVEPQTKDYRSLLTRLQNEEFDVFFPNAQSPAVAAAMMTQFREQGFDQQAIGHDVSDTIELLKLAGEAVHGMHAINVPAHGEGSAFETKFTEKYGEPQFLAYDAHAYDMAGILAEAIGKVGTDGPAVRDYLYNHSGYTGIVGTFTFDANGDVQGIPYVLREFTEDDIVKVKDIAVN